MEAQYGNKGAVVVDITSKSGTKPGFGSIQVFGGSNETVNPSLEYGGTIGEKVRFYIMNSYVTTNRGLEPPTLGTKSYHNQSEKNNTYLRLDYQHDNKNNFSWIFLGSVAKYEVPTIPNLDPNGDVLALLPGFTPTASQSVNQFQKENNQYSQLVWRHDLNASNFFSLGFYFRRGLADFRTGLTAHPAAKFGQIPVQLSQEIRPDPRFQMKIVHILGDQEFQLPHLLQLCESHVPAVRFHQIPWPAGLRSKPFIPAGPQAVWSPEVREARFRADPRSRKENRVTGLE